MSNVCALCGQPLSLFSKGSLICYNEDELFCKSCYDRLKDLPQRERGRIVLAEGKPVHAKGMQAWLDQYEAQQAAKQKAVETGLVCIRCGTPMVKLGRKHFQMGQETLFFDSHLFEGSLEVDIIRCPACRKVEFFLPEAFEPDKF